MRHSSDTQNKQCLIYNALNALQTLLPAYLFFSIYDVQELRVTNQLSLSRNTNDPKVIQILIDSAIKHIAQTLSNEILKKKTI